MVKSRKQKKKNEMNLISDSHEEQLLLSEATPVHLPMAYAKWLPEVSDAPATKKAKSSKHKGAS